MSAVLDESPDSGRRPDSGQHPRSGAKSVLLTLLGEFVLPAGGSVWTSTVVSGLGVLGVTERNARQALARLGDDGIIESVRDGRRSRWHLTGNGQRVLDAGARRIYGFGNRVDEWSGSWLVVTCSIPESDRAKRHRLRTQLGFEGFGFLAPTIAVSPHLDSEQAADRILADLGLQAEAVTLIARSGSMTPDERIVEDAWDLDELVTAYDAFTDQFDDLRSTTPADAFGHTVRLVDAWRRFPFVDPELPAQLLPDGWAGATARAVFNRQRDAWSRMALDWYESSESDV